MRRQSYKFELYIFGIFILNPSCVELFLQIWLVEGELYTSILLSLRHEIHNSKYDMKLKLELVIDLDRRI